MIIVPFLFWLRAKKSKRSSFENEDETKKNRNWIARGNSVASADCRSFFMKAGSFAGFLPGEKDAGKEYRRRLFDVENVMNTREAFFYRCFLKKSL